jgi:hypothetical protein
MTTPEATATIDLPACPPGCTPDLWAQIVESTAGSDLPTIAALFAAHACPSWCVEHFEHDDEPGLIHQGEEQFFGDEDDSPIQPPPGGVAVRLIADWPEAGYWPPRINVYHANHSEITADQARALAAQLTRLADLADATPAEFEAQP